jgi:tetratricopeptide (TPR) repeat protein/pSer/pThr/pTyr-binding forkhead associated (FHA) protein
VNSATSAIARLELVSSEGSCRVFELTQDRVNIGRDGSNIVCLDHSTVSLYHAMLIRTGEHFRVRDLISTNGTYINDVRTTGGELHPGDRVRFGEVELRYEEMDTEPKTAPKRSVLPLGRQRSDTGAATEKQYRIVGADGRTYGPATAAQVKKWIAQGFANAQTWVPAEARENWKQLRQIPEFADGLELDPIPTHLLGTPPPDARWDEPVKVGPHGGPDSVSELEPGTVRDAAANPKRAKTRRRVALTYGCAFLLLALGGSVAAWWFDQWPFNSRGPLRRYARSAEGYIYSDPDYTAAAAAEDAKDYAVLLKNSKELASHYPDSSLAHYILGVAYGKLNFFPDAATEFQQAIKLKPDYIDAWNNLGWAYTQSGKVAEAVGVFQQLVKFTPDDAQAWSNLGGAQAGLGHETEAIASYQMAIQLKPDYADAQFNLGAAYANQGQYVDAIKGFRLALKYRPDFAEAWFNLGVVSSRQGESNEAVLFFQRAIKLRPDYAEAWGGLVKAYLNLHEPDNAGEAAREMKRLDPAKADQLADELSREAPPTPAEQTKSE